MLPVVGKVARKRRAQLVVLTQDVFVLVEEIPSRRQWHIARRRVTSGVSFLVKLGRDETKARVERVENGGFSDAAVTDQNGRSPDDVLTTPAATGMTASGTSRISLFMDLPLRVRTLLEFPHSLPPVRETQRVGSRSSVVGLDRKRV